MPDLLETNKSIYARASLKARQYQPWEGYYLTRKVESEIISDLLDLKDDDTVLEIGCGNGFYSALFSPHVKKIYCGDLDEPCASTHSMGIAKARGLFKELDISNVSLSSFSGSQLPFRNEAFNVVFTSSTLEHIPDREKAVKEIKRVLKPGGRAVIIVPNYITSIYSILHLPLYLIMALFRRAFNRKNPGGSQENLSGEIPRKVNSFSRICEILTPKPHGEYKNLADELKNSYPSKWEKLLTDEGFRVLASRGTIILPWSLISVFSSRFGASLYELTCGFHKRIVARYSFFKYFSYLICIVVKK